MVDDINKFMDMLRQQFGKEYKARKNKLPEDLGQFFLDVQKDVEPDEIGLGDFEKWSYDARRRYDEDGMLNIGLIGMDEKYPDYVVALTIISKKDMESASEKMYGDKNAWKDGKPVKVGKKDD